MKKIIVITMVFGLTLVVSGCTQTTNQNNEQVNTTIEQESATTSQDTSELVLQLTDFSEGFSVVDKRPRVESDISEVAKEYNWQSGYYIKFAKLGENALVENTIIEQSISKYPIETIEALFSRPYDDEEGLTLESLPEVNIGDQSKAYIMTATLDGATEKVYVIEFIRKNIYMQLTMGGTFTDYEMLKQAAQKAAAKIL